MQVAKHADAVWRQKRAALLSRVHFVGGSFLETGAWRFLSANCLASSASVLLCKPGGACSAGVAVRHAGSIPAAHGSGDVYVMRTILHDWSDERATEILRNTRAAIGTASYMSDMR